MNVWLHGWMTNLSLKKNVPACIHIRVTMNKKITLKKKTSQNKKNTINSVANMQE